MLHIAGSDPSSLDPISLVRLIQSVGFTGLLVLNVVTLWRRWFVTGTELEQLRTSMQKLIDDKDAALIRKDQQIQQLHDQNASLNKGMLETFAPALARAVFVMERFHTDTTVRRSE